MKNPIDDVILYKKSWTNMNWSEDQKVIYKLFLITFAGDSRGT